MNQQLPHIVVASLRKLRAVTKSCPLRLMGHSWACWAARRNKTLKARVAFRSSEVARQTESALANRVMSDGVKPTGWVMSSHRVWVKRWNPVELGPSACRSEDVCSWRTHKWIQVCCVPTLSLPRYFPHGTGMNWDHLGMAHAVPKLKLDGLCPNFQHDQWPIHTTFFEPFLWPESPVLSPVFLVVQPPTHPFRSIFGG